MVRVPAPSKEEMQNIVRGLGGDELVLSISEGNIRVAEWCCWAKQQTGEVLPVDWKRSVFDFAQGLLKCRSARDFDRSLRMQLLELLTLVAPEDVMTEVFVVVLRAKLTDAQRLAVPEIAMRHVCFSRGLTPELPDGAWARADAARRGVLPRADWAVGEELTDVQLGG